MTSELEGPEDWLPYEMATPLDWALMGVAVVISPRARAETVEAIRFRREALEYVGTSPVISPRAQSKAANARALDIADRMLRLFGEDTPGTVSPEVEKPVIYRFAVAAVYRLLTDSAQLEWVQAASVVSRDVPGAEDLSWLLEE